LGPGTENLQWLAATAITREIEEAGVIISDHVRWIPHWRKYICLRYVQT
jgi:hypothetical protein